VRKLRENNERKRYLTQDEEQRLMAALMARGAHLRPLILLAINTGMRRGQILSLAWRNGDFQRGVIHVTKYKDRLRQGRSHEFRGQGHSA
jgi:integrase